MRTGYAYRPRAHCVAGSRPRLRRGGWHAFTVRLCNEMGLFDQQWPGCGPSLVRVRLLALGGGGVAAGVRLRLRQVALHAGGGGGGAAAAAAEVPATRTITQTQTPALALALALTPAPALALARTPTRTPALALALALALTPTEEPAAATGGVLVRLERGRAVAEIRAEMRRDTRRYGAEGGAEGGEAGGWGGRAVLWAAIDGSGEAGGGGAGGAGPPTLDFVSVPLPLLPPEAGQELAPEMARGGEGGEGEGEGGEGGGTAAALIGVSAARLLEQREAELVSCLRVLPAEEGGEKRAAVRAAFEGGGDLVAGGGDLVVAESSAQICGRVWDGALALSRWLRRQDLRGASIVELGSGCGVCGLGAAAQGARVVMTDLPEALPLLRLNAALAAPCATSPPKPKPKPEPDPDPNSNPKPYPTPTPKPKPKPKPTRAGAAPRQPACALSSGAATPRASAASSPPSPPCLPPGRPLQPQGEVRLPLLAPPRRRAVQGAVQRATSPRRVGSLPWAAPGAAWRSAGSG